ncbi:pyridoxamine 5'-phosphate oxidase-domain-containing protein [Radiomyces spectabilis]|uniref:pyridoxamine 5'-phosphate oxidase-domain-containing protein n=1 Tax=Radiomyces spectabilis TaxID=64574 RepID=UPI00221F89D9|nr:pyridoxamine 5'-phosphate oxidase-domain-containing protein [Radiomyces spectabilis]KAI8374189.1 pyridoxamine 5'-phosphate oxidase-domain-containing protein [Radiomyces spectabilis]
MDTMTLSPVWKKLLARQLQANIEKLGPSESYVSLATVRLDGTPANRTVVFRGFAGEHHEHDLGWESDLLTITCDQRSAKVKEIKKNPSYEVNWWMSGTQEQFRLHGHIHVYGDQHQIDRSLSSHVRNTKDATKTPVQADWWEGERRRQWLALGDGLRATFAQEAPGEPKIQEPDNQVRRLEIDNVDEQGRFCNKDAAKQALLDKGYKNFVLLFLTVSRVDHLLLPTGERTLYEQQQDGWRTVPLTG